VAKRLSHVSKERLKRLVKNGILTNLNFTDLDICLDCIKGKQTKHTKKGATRSTQLLEIIHTDICGPFDVPSFGGEKYFITFIDDFSRYEFIYLLKEKSHASDVLKVYINEVERQLDRKVKIIRSDRAGEYNAKYNESKQCPGLFAKFLENGEVSGSVERQRVEINEVRVNISLPINVPTSAPITNVVQHC